MAGILPDTSNGGVIFRLLNGTCVGTLPGTYCPGPDFRASCALTGMGDTCESRLTPEQLNSLMSELLALGEAFNPTGQWNCGDANNLARLYGEGQEGFPPGANGDVLQYDANGDVYSDPLRFKNFFPAFDEANPGPSAVYFWSTLVGAGLPNGSMSIPRGGSEVPTDVGVTVPLFARYAHGSPSESWTYLRAQVVPDGTPGINATADAQMLVNKEYLNARLAGISPADGLPLAYIIAPLRDAFSYPAHQRPTAEFDSCLAFGIEAQAIHTDPGANRGGALAVGFSAYANGLHALAVGTNSVAGPGVLGGNNGDTWLPAPTVKGLLFPTAFGNRASARANNALAVGNRADAGHVGSVALGFDAKTTADNTVSVGNPALLKRVMHVATPLDASDAATKGYVDSLSSSGIMAYRPHTGVLPSVTGSTNSIAIGWDATATGIGAITIGMGATNSGSQSTTIGHLSQATESSGVALGAHSDVKANQATAIGFQANVPDASHEKSVALGYASATSRPNEVSVGSGSILVPSTRLVANVSDPTLAQDAATKNYVDRKLQAITPIADPASATTAQVATLLNQVIAAFKTP